MMPAPEGSWGMPPEVVAELPGYGADMEKNRAEARKIMEGLGYSATNPLEGQGGNAQHPALSRSRGDPHRPAEEDSHRRRARCHRHQRLVHQGARGDYMVGLNLTRAAVDDPDINFYENYACGSERNYTKYCNAEVEKLIDRQSRETDVAKRRCLVWEVEKTLASDVARPIVTQNIAGLCWQPHVKKFVLHHNSIYNNWRFDDSWLDK